MVSWPEESFKPLPEVDKLGGLGRERGQKFLSSPVFIGNFNHVLDMPNDHRIDLNTKSLRDSLKSVLTHLLWIFRPRSTDSERPQEICQIYIYILLDAIQ